MGEEDEDNDGQSSATLSSETAGQSNNAIPGTSTPPEVTVMHVENPDTQQAEPVEGEMLNDSNESMFNEVSESEEVNKDEVNPDLFQNNIEPVENNSQKISPGIKEKLDKFQTESNDSKRKPENSPELSKKEKKKIRNLEKCQRKQELIERNRLKL